MQKVRKSLRDFIREHASEIVSQFGGFARTLMPAGSEMSEAEFRDHAEELLTAVMDDLATDQTLDEQAAKSRGLGRAHHMAASGQLHADARIQHGFTPEQLLAEFRALRAAVLRSYELSGETDLQGVRRFNEAIDEALAESMKRYGITRELYRDQFVAILGHDLRNPLGAVTAGAALLAAAAGNDHRQARVASQILNSAQRMERLISDLLDFTRTRLGGAIPLKRVPADLCDVCQQVVLELQAANGSAVIEFDSDGDLTGQWDGDRLAQVVSNLVGNAIQHGDGTAVSLHAQREGNAVVLTVHNTGLPIPVEAQLSIFEPLVRREPDDRQSNSIGLGLYITREIVAAHGGAIRVRSSHHQGTAFTVTLPIVSAS